MFVVRTIDLSRWSIGAHKIKYEKKEARQLKISSRGRWSASDEFFWISKEELLQGRADQRSRRSGKQLECRIGTKTLFEKVTDRLQQASCFRLYNLCCALFTNSVDIGLIMRSSALST